MDTLGPLLSACHGTPLPTPADEARLAARARAGDPQALDRLVRSNLPFVVKVAKGYRHLGVPFEDLVAEGSLGLLESVRRFDPARGVRFVTYATWWVRKHVLAALDAQGRARAAAPVLDGLADPRAPHPARALIERETSARMARAMASLTDQERRVLDHRFGLGGEPPLTLRETGERMRVSRERVRQIERRAVDTLRRRLGLRTRGGERYPRPRGSDGTTPAARPASGGSALRR